MCFPIDSYQKTQQQHSVRERKQRFFNVLINTQLLINEKYKELLKVLTDLPITLQYSYVCLICAMHGEITFHDILNIDNLYEFTKHLIYNHNPSTYEVVPLREVTLFYITTP